MARVSADVPPVLEMEICIAVKLVKRGFVVNATESQIQTGNTGELLDVFQDVWMNATIRTTNH